MEEKKIKEIIPELDSTLLNVLTEMESEVKDEESELVNHDKLFEMVDFERASKVFAKAEQISSSKNTQVPSGNSGGLINEGYLRYLINSEIRKVFDDLSDSLSSQITGQLERTVAMMMQAGRSEHIEKSE